jgi:uncharacterized protein
MITTAALRILAKQGDRDARFRLGYRLAYCRNRALRRPADAIKWWRLAAAKGHARAQFFLGVAFDHGIGAAKNYKTAMGYYAVAAKNGHPEAQYNLALGYRTGEGVKRNAKAEAFWLSQCALQGDVDGQRDFGVCLFYGRGIRRNTREAIRWYRKAARQGDNMAIRNLARVGITSPRTKTGTA